MQTSVDPHRIVPPEAVPIPASGDDNLAILIAPGAIILYSTVSGTSTTLDYETFSTTEDQWYTLRVESDGGNVTVWRSTEGELETEVLSTTSAVPTTTDAVLMGIVNETMSDSPFELDNIRILADDLENTTTFTVNTANQVTALNDFNGTTNFSYDPWGRMTKKNISTTYTANYYYNYGSKMTKASSNFPGEGTVEYEYGGDQKRRSMTASGVTTGYNWDIGWNVVSEEDDVGALARSYVHNPQFPGRATMAHVDGTNPSTGSYSYYSHDNLGSTRALHDQSKVLTASYAYTPYGSDYGSFGTAATTHRFTGHDWSPQSGLYFAPYRFYSPQIGKWTSRDPLGMVDGPNVYQYVAGNSVQNTDPMGQSILACIGAIVTCIVGLIKCLISRSPLTCAAALGACLTSLACCLPPPPPPPPASCEELRMMLNRCYLEHGSANASPCVAIQNRMIAAGCFV